MDMNQVTSPFKPEEFLERIKFSGQPTVSAETLKALHHAQIRSIPFENFDICLNKNIKLDAKSLFDKLVRHQRGGYCFELNGLLLMALQYFGFKARALLGRVHLTGVPTARTHQISLVILDGEKWIVDAGFGSNSPQEPLPLVFNSEREINGRILRFIQHELFGVMLQARTTLGWTDLYSFDLNHVCESDIHCGNYYTSTSPASLFVCSRVASLPIENGLITLSNFTLKKTVGDEKTTQELQPGQTYINALRENFGIELTCSYDQLKEVVYRNIEI